ncbi:hypothetical protein SEUCBS139899_007761 [Sporothrix eucalyptigena]|uniref:BZIP transcription factor n=1 Tax=Sporothrix eucalyptigena TaxID=1812306 RepID=A0ABP0B379_9PEZI
MANKPDPAARRVQNMTRSQIEHKRAIDRANQQICQRRKRARVQWLEGEVSRLVGELEAAKARISELEAEKGGCTAVVAPIAPALVGELDINPVFTRTKNDGEADDEGPSAHSNDDRESLWAVHLRDLLDANYDDPFANFTMDYPIPLPADSPSPPVASPGGLLNIPPWQALPLHLPPQTDIDHFIIETIALGRRLLEQTAAEELSHAQFPSISSLLNPNLGDDGSKPLTSALASHVVRYSTIQPVTSRIAIMYKLSHLLRWLVCRNRQSYEKLPDFLKPTLLQRTVPHPPWVDAITWPVARDRIIQSRAWETFPFDEFRRSTGSVSVNWPFTDSGAFLDLGDGQNQVLSPMFEDHIRRCENWSLSKSTTQRFPFMRDEAARAGKGNS